MKNRFVASIDQGTTGTRCAIYDESGKAVGWSYKRHTQFYPNEVWVEHNPCIDVLDFFILNPQDPVNLAFRDSSKIVLHPHTPDLAFSIPHPQSSRVNL